MEMKMKQNEITINKIQMKYNTKIVKQKGHQNKIKHPWNNMIT